MSNRNIEDEEVRNIREMRRMTNPLVWKAPVGETDVLNIQLICSFIKERRIIVRQ